MKFIKYFLILAIVPVLGFGPPQGKKKVAVTTFYVNKYIGTEGLGSGASMVAAISTLADDPNFNLQPILDKFHKTFFTEYAKSFPFDLLPEEEVTGNEDYKAYESRFGETSDADRSKMAQRYLVIDGYKPLIEGALIKKENRNQTKMIEIFDANADGVMFVNMDYSFITKGGVGPLAAVGIKAFVRIKLWNKESKKVFAINESAVSKATVGMVGGIPVMDTDKLLPMCQDASDRLLEDLKKRLPKIAARSAKKFQ
ncbi:MAG: hypothetical protein ACFB10_06995 [Salibacteraceae bacterium]